MRDFPVMLQVEGRECLVIGQNRETAEKAGRLEKAGARVRFLDSYRESEIGHPFLIVADVSAEEARTLWQYAERERILLNVVDKPQFCHFTFPAVLERGDLRIAVSTCGTAPALAGWLRDRLEESLSEHWPALLAVAKQLRSAIVHHLPGWEARKQYYRSLAETFLRPPSEQPLVRRATRSLPFEDPWC